jgi:hypothetical protein
MDNRKYLPRIADAVLQRRLRSKGAVLIEGPKWCGKTSTAAQVAGSMLNLADLNVLNQVRNMVQVTPNAFLDGDVPRLIDEWQGEPRLWDAVRNEVDIRQATGQFILTGSAVPADRSEILHSGTGRFSLVTMRTMSLWESGDSTGDISLADIFAGKTGMYGKNKCTLDDVARLICRGGWPMAAVLGGEPAMQQAVDYYDAVINFDIGRADGTRRSPETANRLMRSYARHIGLQSTLTTIRDDISNGGASIDIATVTSYINALKRIFVIEEMPAWNPNLRSKTAIRTTDTRYLTDPSIGCAALGIGPADLVSDLKTMGMMFECLCVRDLRVYADALDGRVYHYRDSNGLECDSVLHLRNGRYGLIEIKLGGDRLIEEGVSTLLKLAKKIDTDKMHEPTFLMVLTAVGDYAYLRPDGVWVVPIGALKV